MALAYKIIQKGQPGVTGGGTKLNYASLVSGGEMTLENLTKILEKRSTVSGADLRAVVYGIVDAVKDSLEDGKIVRLGDLGSLRMSLKSKGEATEEDVTSFSIEGVKFIFTPGPMLKDMVKTLKYVKAS